MNRLLAERLDVWRQVQADSMALHSDSERAAVQASRDQAEAEALNLAQQFGVQDPEETFAVCQAICYLACHAPEHLGPDSSVRWAVSIAMSAAAGRLP